MTEQTGKAIVTTDNLIVPIAIDGENTPVPVSSATVDAALKEFDFQSYHLGFHFAKAVTAKVELEDGSELQFMRRENATTRYRFASKVVSLADFNTAAKYDSNRKLMPASTLERIKQEDGTFYEDAQGRLWAFFPSTAKDTVLINKAGDRLWPRPKA